MSGLIAHWHAMHRLRWTALDGSSADATYPEPLDTRFILRQLTDDKLLKMAARLLGTAPPARMQLAVLQHPRLSK